jgi:hypothetical protein
MNKVTVPPWLSIRGIGSTFIIAPSFAPLSTRKRNSLAASYSRSSEAVGNWKLFRPVMEAKSVRVFAI